MIDIKISYPDKVAIQLSYNCIQLYYTNGYYWERITIAQDINIITNTHKKTGILIFIEIRCGNKCAIQLNNTTHEINYISGQCTLLPRDVWKRYTRKMCTDEEIAAMEKFYNEIQILVKK
jgi:hypothetical protein